MTPPHQLAATHTHPPTHTHTHTQVNVPTVAGGLTAGYRLRPGFFLSSVGSAGQPPSVPGTVLVSSATSAAPAPTRMPLPAEAKAAFKKLLRAKRARGLPVSSGEGCVEGTQAPAGTSLPRAAARPGAPYRAPTIVPVAQLKG